MEITLGPILYDWPKADVLAFYDEAASLDVDVVHIGEVVCSRRKGFALSDMAAVAEKLAKAGKKVFLSTLAVVANDDELSYIRELARLPYGMEANDMSAVAIAVEAGKKDIAVGPHILAYNADDVDFLKSVGVSRFTMPVELPAATIAHIIKSSGITAEVFCHGRMPLAFSWRCYTARSFNRLKSECRMECADFPDGMELKTLSGEPIFSINGTSVMSADVYTLVDKTDELKTMGVKALRISPDKKNTGRIVDVFRKRLNGAIDSVEALAAIKAVSGERLCNGWYFGKAGKDLEGMETI